MDLFGLSPAEFKSLILTLIRVSVVLFMFPFFGGAMIPMPIKAGLALMVTLLLFPVVRPDPAVFPVGLLGLVNIVLAELILGLIIGLMARLFFAAIQLAGQLIGFQMGFAIASVLDPETGSQGSVLAQWGYWIAILFFLILNGHHILLQVLRDSFAILDVGALRINGGIFKKILVTSGDMFVLSMKIGAPAVAALLLTSAAFGIVARVTPQMNILIVAFPIKIVVGLFFFGFSLEILLFTVKRYVAGFEGMLGAIIRLVKV